MKLATTTGDFNSYTHSQIKSLEYIKEAGFKYADYSFELDYSFSNGVYSKDHQRYLNEIIESTDKMGVKLVQAHSPMGRPIAEDNAKFIENTIRCVDACGVWGIPNLVIHTGYSKGLTVEETFKKNKEFFLPILERAEKYGVNILVENFNKMSIDGLYWIDNATDLLGFIESVNHPLMHAVWDTGHANHQTKSQYDEIKLLKSHIRGLHINDNMGVEDSHALPFSGTLNIDAVMNGLKDIGYTGYFTFEACNTFVPKDKRVAFEKDKRLESAPLELKRHIERYMYELGKCILTAYDCFEE